MLYLVTLLFVREKEGVLRIAYDAHIPSKERLARTVY
jgi:hypothetical protein